MATEDDLIANMILRIMCECWLDHIYINKIKFSHFGAYQLLTDFEHVETWTNNNTIISPEMKLKLLKNEVLRRCEGVGKLLLRMPGERIKMSDSTPKLGNMLFKMCLTGRIDVMLVVEESPKSDMAEEWMPPEMYVPNQKQWLELRAHGRRSIFSVPLCCDVTTIAS